MATPQLLGWPQPLKMGHVYKVHTVLFIFICLFLPWEAATVVSGAGDLGVRR